MPRRFPQPWTVHRMPAGFRVADANGCWLVYVYGQGDAMRISGLQGLDFGQAVGMAHAITKLPALLTGAAPSAPLALPAAGPWTVDETDHGFAVNAGLLRLAYVYCADDRAGDLTRDEARRIAAGVARLPELVGPTE